MDNAVYANRRDRLRKRVSGPILLVGNGERSRNLPMNKVPYRQDSTLLYFTGCRHPGAAALLDDDGFTLFLPEPADDDALWHGHVTSLEEHAQTFAADQARPRRELARALSGRRVRTLAVADELTNRELSELTGTPLRFGSDHGDEALMDAVIDMRRRKDAHEIEAIKTAARHTEVAFDAVIRGTRPGGHERALTALFEGVLAARGLATGYDTILSQSGEVLHNHAHEDVLESGRMVLLDGGGEVRSGYGVDITRTWPVDGTFTDRQRSAYQAVLAAQKAGIDTARKGVRNRAVHDASSRVLTEWLVDEGFIKCSVDDAFARHAHALFFPHGIGHHLGLDVHDLENFGDRASYPAGQGRPDFFGTRYLRMDLPLEVDWVITVEPGFYVVPAILEDQALVTRFEDIVDFDRARSWYGFGGIRIEDDLRITEGAAEVLTAVPKSLDDIEAMVGTATSAEERLCFT